MKRIMLAFALVLPSMMSAGCGGGGLSEGMATDLPKPGESSMSNLDFQMKQQNGGKMKIEGSKGASKGAPRKAR